MSRGPVTPRERGPGTALTDLHLEPVVVLRSDATLLDVAQVMTRSGKAAVVVGDGRSIVTERDLVWATARGRPATEAAVNVATSDPWSIPETASALDALAAMVRHEIRHLVVVDATDHVVGLVSLLQAAETVLGDAELPHWLAALRLALRVDVRSELPPTERSPERAR